MAEVGGVFNKASDGREPIDIILLTHGRLEDLTIPCVRAIYANTRNLFHLIVIDDSTPDMDEGKDYTPLWFKRLQIDQQNITFIHSDIPYKSGNQVINIGLAQGNNRFVTVLGNSSFVEPDWDITPVQLMAQKPKIGLIGMKCLKGGWNERDDGQIESAGVFMQGYMPCDLGRDESAHRLSLSYPCFSLQWSHILLRREAVAGNLDEGLWRGFVGWDDLDNSVYIRYKGWEAWYCGLSSSYHRTHATRGNDSIETLQKNRINAEIFYKRWGYWDMFRALNPYASEYFPGGEIKYLCDANKLPLQLNDISLQIAQEISSSLDSNEGQALISLAQRVAKPDAVLVEVGSWTGCSSSSLAQVIRAFGGHLYCVDHWEGSTDTALVELAKNNDVYKIFETNLTKAGLWDYLTPLIMDSKTACDKFEDASIDFLFIDGDHRYQQFKEDLDRWLPKMKANGIICGHDCEGYYSKLSPEAKARIDSRLEDDYTGIYHAGVIKGLFDLWGNDYSIFPDTRIWFKELGGNAVYDKIALREITNRTSLRDMDLSKST